MVTSMTIKNNYLISGSKDKNLKLWSLNSAIKNLKTTFNIHSDYVNTLQSIPQSPFFYSGSRNG
jgi:WD40 repeat protein